MGQSSSTIDAPAVVGMVRLIGRTATRVAQALAEPFAALGHPTGRASRLEVELFLLSRVVCLTLDRDDVSTAVYRGYFRYRVGRPPTPQDAKKPVGFVARLGERFRTYEKVIVAAVRDGADLPMELVLGRFIIASGDADEPTAAYGIETRSPDANDLRRRDLLVERCGQFILEFDELLRAILLGPAAPLALSAEDVDEIARRVLAAQKAAANPPPLPGKVSAVQLPPRLGPFVRGEVRTYDQSLLGQSAAYGIEGLRPTITLYVYPGDAPADEPDRLRAVRRELTRATDEAVAMWQSRGLGRPRQTPGRRQGLAGASDWMITYLEPAGSGEIGSVVAISARAAAFIKFRLTYPIEDHALTAEIVRTFLDAVAEAGVGDRRDGQTDIAVGGTLPAVEALSHLLVELTPNFHADLIRAAEADFRPGTAAVFELRAWFTSRMINVAQTCGVPADLACAVFDRLAETVAVRTPGNGGPAAALQLIAERVRHYQLVTTRDGATPRDELGLAADYLLAAGSADVPEAFSGWPPRPNDADRSALIAALIAADRGAGQSWLGVCRVLFADAVPLAEMSGPYVLERLNQCASPVAPPPPPRPRTYDTN